MQEMTEFRLEWAGDAGIEVFERRMKAIAVKWVQARKWSKGVEEKEYPAAWRFICGKAIEQSRWMMEEQMKAVALLKASGWPMEAKNKVVVEEYEETAKRIKDNLEVQFRNSLWLRTPFVGEDFQAHLVEGAQVSLLKDCNAIY